MKFFRRIVLFSLALLVLVSSTGFSVGMHLCAGEVRDLTFYGEATECLMGQKKETLPPCHAPEKEKAPQSSCCEDHQLVVERLDMASDSKALVLIKKLDLKFIAAVKAVILQLFGHQEGLKSAYALYTSPPIARDIPVLVQSFLI
ncbi:HYC_CC_PP family protein [Pontibacter saemangeumensis]|uniref:HYC_CC_PP family protein n=1 Tax=Pontibacter saemangeumensis TaxID=1084525 RepID=UPI0031F0C273